VTLPEQSDRAVAQTREFLVRLASPYVENGIKGVRREIRAEALALLRHYPYVWSGEAIAKCDCPVQDNAANADNPCPYVTGKTTQYCTLTPFTLTDEEREALERVAELCDFMSTAKTNELAGQDAATLRGLLERL
jgi:hypothetical protein